MKLIIDTELCTACKLCSQVCIRDNIYVEDFAVEMGGTVSNVDIVWQYVKSVQ
ncbi:MAG: 4Fe-4S binding protein [archaeon]|nr:4Fe-4S binding protein [archaeon]